MSGLAAVPVEPFTFLRQLRAAEEELLCDEAYDQREEEGEDPVARISPPPHDAAVMTPLS
jgi:hypothetical protein